MSYVPAIDGIRALAVLIVIAFHARTPGFDGGYVGVDIFFVLSGFLITSLLQEEYGRTGSLRIGHFYLRRLARLTPALLGMLALYLAIAPITWPDYERHASDALIAASYLSDSIPMFWATPSPLRHTWSLSVEQHYYLVWPIFILLVSRHYPTRLTGILLAAYVCANLWRWYCIFSGQGWDAVYYRFDLRLSGLILGSWIAAKVHHNPEFHTPSFKLMAPMTVLAVVIILGSGWKNLEGLLFSIPAAELLACYMLLIVREPGNSTLHKVMNRSTMIYLGKISYGLYLYHFPVIFYLRDAYDWRVALAAGLPVSIALAALSYHTVEAWLRAKRNVPAVTARGYEAA